MSEEPKRSTRHQAAGALAMLGLVIMAVGCSYSIPHPPTFADFRRVGPRTLEDEKKLEASIAVFEAAQFLSTELEIIRSNGNPRELIGAVLQAKLDGNHVGTLLREAAARGSNDPVVLAGVAVRLLREEANGIAASGNAPSLAHILTALERLEPDNGLPQFVRAYVQMKQGDTNAARLSLITATQQPTLRLYGSELRSCVVQAALSVKYPRYTAFMLALGNGGFNTAIAVVGKGLLNNPQVDRATAEACLELGRRHEAQSTLFIDQLIAAAVQKPALEFLKPPGYEKELERIKNAKDRIKEAIIFLDSPKAHTTAEREGLAYFETLFNKSEFEAVKELARKLNYKL
jgi:hypothetical protein